LKPWNQLGPGQTWDGVYFSASGDTADAEGHSFFYFSRRADHVQFTVSDRDWCCLKELFSAVLERPELRSMLDHLAVEHGEI
jgi:hypothetical protein